MPKQDANYKNNQQTKKQKTSSTINKTNVANFGAYEGSESPDLTLT